MNDFLSRLDEGKQINLIIIEKEGTAISVCRFLLFVLTPKETYALYRCKIII